METDLDQERRPVHALLDMLPAAALERGRASLGRGEGIPQEETPVVGRIADAAS